MTQEIAVSIAILILSYVLFSHFDLLEKFVEWSSQHEQYEIDEILSTSIVLVFLLLIFSFRRWRETDKKTNELQDVLKEIKILKGVIPICSYCKKIRDDDGVWNQLEAYIHSHSDAAFSHGACPECYTKQIENIANIEQITKEKG